MVKRALILPILHAFVDGELASRERIQVLEATRRSPALGRRLAELQQLKHAVQSAYRNPADGSAADTRRTVGKTRHRNALDHFFRR
jgi:anti-sigma factor RsiW